MVELVIAAALVLGAWRGVRLRHWFVLPAALSVLYVLTADTLAALALDGPVPALHAFVVLLLGPGGSLLRGEGPLPLPALARQWPLLLRLTCVVLSLFNVMASAFARQRLNPQHPRAIGLDRVSAPFLLVAVLESMVTVQLLLVTELAD